MKKILFVLLLFSFAAAKAQMVDSIYVNLYTDSLKKGTYNYINIDGLLSNGKYIPLDSNHLVFRSSYGKFYGNSLLIDRDCRLEKITIDVTMKKNPSLHKEFVMFLKKNNDNEKLPTSRDVFDKIKKKG